MEKVISKSILFVSSARSEYGRACLRMLIDSLRTFGGEIGRSPCWIFDPQPEKKSFSDWKQPGVEVLPLHVPEAIEHYLFASKVSACAQAEAMMAGKANALVWIDPNCLVVNPPVLYSLGEEHDAAVRPVHIRNVGLPVGEPLDAFWRGIYKVVGVQDIEMSVQSFVDQQTLRAYFNSHALAVNPSLGLMQRWLEGFQALVCDQEFQSNACQDEAHQIFLFQALLSALLVASVGPRRLRILPPAYNYPYNLQQSIAPERRARTLDELVSFTYEDKPVDPAVVNDIAIEEPLRAWLLGREEIKISSA
jgi:hypothetical protein